MRLPRQQRTADAARESEVVADQRARPRLTPDPEGVDHQRPEALRGAVHRGGEAGGAGADDEQVDLAVLGLDRGAGGPRELDVARVHELRAVREDHDRQLRVGWRVAEELASLVGVGQAERVRESTLLEHRPELRRASRPRAADDVDRVGSGAPLLRPLEQEGRDGMVEELVRRRDGPHDVVVDLAVLDRLEDRVARGAEPPFAPADEQGALRVRMELPDLAEELAAGAAVQRLAREYDGDGLARRLDLRQVTAGLRGRGDAHDAVVACVPLVELALDRGEIGRIVVDRENDRLAHGDEDTARRVRPGGSAGSAAHPAERGANGRHVVHAVTARPDYAWRASADRVGLGDVRRQVRGRRAARRREDPDHRQLDFGVGVLDDVHLARAQPEGGARLERLDRLAEVESSPPAEDPDDLVVEVVVPRRRAGRDVPHEDRGAGRSVVRAVEHLERARAGRLPRLDMVEGDHGLGRPHRRMEVGGGAERHPEDRGTVRSGDERATAPGGDEARAGAVEGHGVEGAGAVREEAHRVVEVVGDLDRGAGAEADRLERESRPLLGRDEASPVHAVLDVGGHGVGSRDAGHLREHRLDDRRRPKEPRMPLIRVELFDFRVDEETSAKLIAGLTDALCAATHEGLRDHTWVIVEGHDPKNWGLGGKPWPVGDMPPGPS